MVSPGSMGMRSLFQVLRMLESWFQQAIEKSNLYSSSFFLSRKDYFATTFLTPYMIVLYQSFHKFSKQNLARLLPVSVANMLLCLKFVFHSQVHFSLLVGNRILLMQMIAHLENFDFYIAFQLKNKHPLAYLAWACKITFQYGWGPCSDARNRRGSQEVEQNSRSYRLAGMFHSL